MSGQAQLAHARAVRVRALQAVLVVLVPLHRAVLDAAGVAAAAVVLKQRGREESGEPGLWALCARQRGRRRQRRCRAVWQRQRRQHAGQRRRWRGAALHHHAAGCPCRVAGLAAVAWACCACLVMLGAAHKVGERQGAVSGSRGAIRGWPTSQRELEAATAWRSAP